MRFAKGGTLRLESTGLPIILGKHFHSGSTTNGFVSSAISLQNDLFEVVSYE